VSLAWAGRRSENIASVYLLYHLFDKTDFSGFWEQCRRLGLDPDNFSSRAAFERMVRDSLGVVLDAEHLRELRYQKAAADLAVDLTFDGSLREAAALRALPYGLGYARERDGFNPDSLDDEARLRLGILERNYLDYAASAAIGDALHLESGISPETLRALEERLRPAEAAGDRYSRENLYASKDFRAQAALRYIKDFSRRLDVTSPLDGVLSFPLGVNVITLGEAVNAYQVFQEGARYRTRFGNPQLYIERILTADGRVIFEDYAESEEVLADRTRFMLEAILASVVQGGTGQRIGRELRMPIGNPPISMAVPAYGKTGTTNDYRNAAFLGFIAAPRGQGKGFDPAAGYAIGVYTGFDDNRSMTRPGFRGTGAAAAIPAWLGIAQAIVSLKNYPERVETPDPDSWNAEETPIFQRDQYKLHKVSRRTGLPLSQAEDPAYAEDLSDELAPAEILQPGRDYAPLWIRED
jgi:hypothetical protein